jgi:chaperonin cofactor prefoldin
MSRLEEFEEAYRESHQKLFDLYQLRNTNVQMAQALERERRLGQLVNTELKQLPKDNVCYKTIGKMFIQKSVDELEEEIKKNDDFLQEELSKLQKKRVAIQENVEKEENNFRGIYEELERERAK